MAKISFEKWMAKQIEAIAESGKSSDPDFREYLNVYLGLIERGMPIRAAKRVMDWYMES